jgi:signal transduction histidine kinase
MTRACDQCGADYDAKRPSSRFCSARCRNRHSRAAGSRPKATKVPNEAPAEQPPDTAIADHVARELGDQANTAAGQMAVALARRLDANIDTGSAMAAVARELRTLMTEVLGTQPQAADPIDELRARRDRRPA